MATSTTTARRRGDAVDRDRPCVSPRSASSSGEQRRDRRGLVGGRIADELGRGRVEREELAAPHRPADVDRTAGDRDGPLDAVDGPDRRPDRPRRQVAVVAQRQPHVGGRRYAACWPCDASQVAASDTANVPSAAASMSRSAERV